MQPKIAEEYFEGYQNSIEKIFWKKTLEISTDWHNLTVNGGQSSTSLYVKMLDGIVLLHYNNKLNINQNFRSS